MVIELSGVQFGLKSYAWFQNWTSAQREFDLKSQVWFQTKIARHKVQLPLYYIHFEIAQIQDLVSSNILLKQYWAGLKSNSTIFLGEKEQFWKQKLQNLPHNTLCLTFSCTAQIALHKVQLPLYYNHFEIAQIQDLVSSNILLMQYWTGLKLNSSIFWGGKSKSWQTVNKSCKICHMILLCHLFFCNLIGYFEQAFKSDWLFCF